MNGCSRYRSATAITVAWIAAAIIFAPAASGQSAWKPERPVEIVSGTSGGGADRLARLIQNLMQEKRLVATPVNVITKIGAGNSIAFNYVNQKAGDGHFLLVGTLSLSINYLTGTGSLGFRDFTPICTLFDEYVALAVRADSPLKTGRDLVERLRKDPTSVSIGITSLGGANHLAATLVLKTAGVDVKKVRTVAFDSAGKAMVAVLGGHVDVAPMSTSVPVSHLQAGTVRVIGITAPRRLGGAYADVPTWREQDVKAEFSSYRSFAAPKGLADAQISYWENVFAAIDQDERWRENAEKTFVHLQFRRSRETLKYWLDLEGPMKAVLGELGMLK